MTTLTILGSVLLGIALLSMATKLAFAATKLSMGIIIASASPITLPCLIVLALGCGLYLTQIAPQLLKDAMNPSSNA